MNINNFNKISLPKKNYSDFSMSSDGRCITVVCHLSQQGSSEQFLKSFNRDNVNYLNFWNKEVSGSLDRRNHLSSMANTLKNYIYSGEFFSDGSVYSSWDFGVTWQVQSGLKPKNWVSVDMSSDGKVQTIVGRGLYKNFTDQDVIENTPTHIYISYNSGVTWEPKCTSRTWNAISVSKNGQVMLASDTFLKTASSEKEGSFGPCLLDNNILISRNSGIGWEIGYNAPISYYYDRSNEISGYYDDTSFASAGALIGSDYSTLGYFGRKQACLSNDGKYQLIASVNGVTVNSGYGVDDYTRINPNLIHKQKISTKNSNNVRYSQLYSRFLPLCADMSNNGQYQIIGGQGFNNSSGIFPNFNPIDKSAVFRNLEYSNFIYPDLYFSADYGVNWNAVHTLPVGLMCLSVNISQDLRKILVLARPNSKDFQTRRWDKIRNSYTSLRYGSDKKYANFANYISGDDDIYNNLILFESNNSGITWDRLELPITDPKFYPVYSNFLSQDVVGMVNPLKYNLSTIFHFNYPEVDWLAEKVSIDNFNSRLKISNDSNLTGILNHGELLLSNSFQAKCLSSGISGFKPFINNNNLSSGSANWRNIKTGENLIKDIAINGADGRYITYIKNTNSFSKIFGSGASITTPVYSGNYLEYTHGLSNLQINIESSYSDSFICSSSNSGISWNIYSVPKFSGNFTYKNQSYNNYKPRFSGVYPNNLSKVAISENGQHQIVLSDGFFHSGYTLIPQPDNKLSLYKADFYSACYVSNNFGVNWSQKLIKCPAGGLAPEDLHISPDGSTYYFLGKNYGNIYFENIETQYGSSRLDSQVIKESKIVPFATEFCKNKISYIISGAELPGKSVYFSYNSGKNWDQKSLYSGLKFSGIRVVKGIPDSDFESAISGAMPASSYKNLGGIEDNFFGANIFSLAISNWTLHGHDKYKASGVFLPLNNLLKLDQIALTKSSGSGFYINPYSNGILVWNDLADTYAYKNILTSGYYNSRLSQLNDVNIQESFKIKDFKISNNASVQIIYAELPFYSDKKPCGSFLNNYSSSELGILYLSRDAGKTWNAIHGPALIKDIQISNDGSVISYLPMDSSFYEDAKLNSYGKGLMLDEGLGFGVPYVSTNSGYLFTPILRWEKDIERRGAHSVGYEFLDDSKVRKTTWSSFGNTDENIVKYSYNILGFTQSFSVGDTKNFEYYETGEKILSNEEFLKQTSIGSCDTVRVGSKNFYTFADLNNSINNYKISSNGRYQIITCNGQKSSIKKLDSLLGVSGLNSEFFNCIDPTGFKSIDYENFFSDCKIFLNDQSGRFITGNNSVYFDSGHVKNNKLVSGNIDLYPLKDHYLGPKSLNIQTGDNISGVFISFDDKILYSNKDSNRQFDFKFRGVSCSNQIIYGVSGVPLFQSKKDEIIKDRFFTTQDDDSFAVKLYSGSNLYLTASQNFDDYGFITSREYITGGGLFPDFFGEEITGIKNLPSGLSFSTPNLITGVPKETGLFLCKVPFGITGESGAQFTIGNSYFHIFISNSGSSSSIPGDPSIKSLYVGYESGKKESIVSAKIKRLNFYSVYDSPFISNNLQGLSGFGCVSFTAPSGSPGSGYLSGLTGLYNLVSYETGTLVGDILSLDSEYTWERFDIVGTGDPRKVFFDHELGRTSSYNKIYIDPTRLERGDILQINNVKYVYTDSQDEADASVFGFNDLHEFMLYDAPLAGVTGYYDGLNTLHFYSYPLKGDDANLYFISRDTSDLNSIIIPNRYFTGGSIIRDVATNWTGDVFSGRFFNFTRENSGFYAVSDQLPYTETSGSGIVWDNSWAKTLSVRTGAYSNFLPGNIILTGLEYQNGISGFFGSGIVPSGQDATFSGIRFLIQRSKFDENETGIANFSVSGIDFLYTGQIYI
jgi:hypothetical protein